MGKKSKKDFSKFKSRSSEKRRSKERARRELIGILDSISVSHDGLRLHTAYDQGRRGGNSATRSEEVLCEGIFEAAEGGYGFVRLSGGERDVFIPADKTHGAISGDLVSASYRKYRAYSGEERTEGRIKKIIKEGRDSIVGILISDEKRYGRGYRREFFVSSLSSAHRAKLTVSDLGGARLGDKVQAKIVRAATPYCNIVKSFGPSSSKEANYSAILAEEGIITEFSAEELLLAHRLSAERVSCDGRVDLRDEVIFTIDSESAKDLDDAISVRKIKGGYRLSVHIADVSHYVPERSALERCAVSRGTSVYFTDKVVPMLPEALSNGACSLNAGEDKYALSCVMDIGNEGEIKKTEIFESVIRSSVRGVYSEINRLLSGDKSGELIKKYKAVSTALSRAVELYEILKRKNTARGALDLDAPEAEIVLNGGGEVVDIVRRERGLSERIIEQFMLAANEAVATRLRLADIPCVYRIHEPPVPDKLEVFKLYMQNLGFNVGAISRNPDEPINYQALLSLAAERGIAMPVSYTLLRSMSKAKYSEKHTSHFGLGIENYCHFTSPIRRLADLAVHRIIKRVLLSGKRKESYLSFARRCAVCATEGELRALAAERGIDNLYKTVYMSERVGEEFDAIVSSVTSFGIFCTLDNTVEGIIPLSDMGEEYIFEEKMMRLRGRHDSFTLGDRLRVRLVECDISRGRMRFEIVEGV